MRRRGRLVVCAALGLSLTVGAAAADAAVKARGSVEQVYVTGLRAGRDGVAPRPQRPEGRRRSGPTSSGGLLFRSVKPGDGYRVRLGRRRRAVGAADGALDSARRRRARDVYDQAIPSSGYGYLTTRDGTKLAINVHPPQDVPTACRPATAAAGPRPGPTPTLIEYSGYGYADPAGPESGIAVLAQPDGLRGRRREHARHRLLRRRLRLLRAAAEPRRLRRDRDDRAPAVGRSTARSG